MWRLATTPGSTSPTLFEQWCGFFHVPQEPDKCKCCETGPTVFCPYSRRLESLNRLQMSLQRQHFLLSYLKTLSVGPAGVRTRNKNENSPWIKALLNKLLVFKIVKTKSGKWPFIKTMFRQKIDAYLIVLCS